MSPPKIPTGAQIQSLSTGDLAQHLRFVVRQCALKMSDWSGWPAVAKLATEAYWTQHLTGGPQHATVDDTQITITPRLATCASLEGTYPRYRADLVFDVSVSTPEFGQMSRPEPNSSSADDSDVDNDQHQSLDRTRSRTVRTGTVLFRLSPIGMSPLTQNRSSSGDSAMYRPSDDSDENECTPGDEHSAPPPKPGPPGPPPSALETFITDIEMKQTSMNYAAELASLKTELEAGLGRTLTAEEDLRLTHLTQLRVRAQEALSLAQHRQAAIDHQVTILRYLKSKQVGGHGHFFSFGPYEDVSPSFWGELAGSADDTWKGWVGAAKGIVKSFEQSSARYHKAAVKSGNPFAPMLSGFMAAADGAIAGIAHGQKTATEAIASLLESKALGGKAIATLKLALGLGEMVLSAADLVTPFARLGKIKPRGGGPMLAGAVAGAGVHASGTGAVSAALSLAPKSLAANTIMMAVAKSDSTANKHRHATGTDSKVPQRSLLDIIVDEANLVAAPGGEITAAQRAKLRDDLPKVQRRGVKANRASRKMFERAQARLISEWERNTKRVWPKKATPHHIIPLESGGSNKWWNLMPTYGKLPNHSLTGIPGPHAKGGALRNSIQKGRKSLPPGTVTDLRKPHKDH